MNDSLRRAIREIGSEMSPRMFAETHALFAPIAVGPDAGCAVARDIAYGPDARHRLDLFTPVAGGSGLPVIVYAHGGGFVAGDKGGPTDPFYNNVGAWAVREGFIGVTVTYRLAPDHPWPAGAVDIAMGVDWLRDHVEAHGGDPARIFLMGHSAGAVHVASYVAMPHLHGKGPRIAAAIMLSGVYDVTRIRHDPLSQAYFGTDESVYEERSPLRGLIVSDIPCLFSVAEYDPFIFQAQARMLVDDWFEAAGKWPRILYLVGHNHLSSVLGIGLDPHPLAAQLTADVRRFGPPDA